MKRLVAGLLALAAMSAWAAPALAQSPTFDWWTMSAPYGMRSAWAVKSEGDGSGKPQLMALAREAKAGTTPGSEIRTGQLITFEVDCAQQKVHPLTQVTYDAAFAESGSRTAPNTWVSFSSLGQSAVVPRLYCTNTASVGGATSTRHDITGAQRWLDGQFPPPTPKPPSGNLSFELAGMGDDMEGIHIWLETTSIKRDGAKAIVWVYEVLPRGWAASGGRFSYLTPMTWREYTIDCGAKPNISNSWFAQYTPTLASANAQYGNNSNVSADINSQQILKRVCNNRAMLFSKTYTGDLKSMLGATYLGAKQAINATTAYQPDPSPQRVDLGDTIRITEKGGAYSYVTTLKRSSAGSDRYEGETSLADGSNKFASRVTVLGIVNGMLTLERAGVIKGNFAIPVTNGKVSGKGIAYWKRDNDAYSWTLTEPTTITLKTHPVPAPAPAAFQLPAVVKFREASTKPGEGVYEAIWTRRGTSNIYDGAWTYLANGQKFSDVLEVRGIENGKFVVYRQGIKGTYSFPMANGKPARGTASWVSDPAFYVELLLN